MNKKRKSVERAIDEAEGIAKAGPISNERVLEILAIVRRQRAFLRAIEDAGRYSRGADDLASAALDGEDPKEWGIDSTSK